jgi:hypothetical protein
MKRLQHKRLFSFKLDVYNSSFTVGNYVKLCVEVNERHSQNVYKTLHSLNLQTLRHYETLKSQLTNFPKP